MEFLTTMLSFTVVIGVLIFVHEFGHFIVAKRTGVEVEKFSLGFGPKLIGFRKGETQYMISAIPLGGYVKLKGENPEDSLTNDPKEFGSRSVGVRGAIVAAGPVMNFLLTFVLMPCVFILGIQVPVYLEDTPIVCWVAQGSTGEQAGFEVGDRIQAIDGEEVRNWEDFFALVQTKLAREVIIDIERENKLQQKTIYLSEPGVGTGMGGIGLFHKMDARVGAVIGGTPAEQASLKPGDLVTAIGPTDVFHWIQMSEIIKHYLGEEILLHVSREGEPFTVSLTPVVKIDMIENGSPAENAALKAGDTIHAINGKEVSQWKDVLLGNDIYPEKLTFEIVRNDKTRTVDVTNDEMDDLGIVVAGKIGIVQFEEVALKQLGVIDAIKEGFLKTIELSGKIFWILGKLFTLQLSIKALGGPIIIAQMSGSAAKSGLASLLFFIAFLSLNLSVLNLLPIPILDGGHLLFLLIELVMRKPLDTKKMELAQKVGLALLLLLILTVTYNDIIRSVPQKYLDFLPWR